MLAGQLMPAAKRESIGKRAIGRSIVPLDSDLTQVSNKDARRRLLLLAAGRRAPAYLLAGSDTPNAARICC